MTTEFQRSNLRKRKALRLEQLTDADIAAIEAAKVPDEFEYLNSEMELKADESKN